MRFRTNYGYSKGDDTLFKTLGRSMDFDAKHEELLNKGMADEKESAHVSVTIKYTTEFAKTLSVFMENGLNLVAAWTINVRLRD